jgi:hypothetical protein
MNHIKNGTLQPEHMTHMNSMYPELTSYLQKQLTQRIMNSQLDNESLPGKTQRSLSMFLGAPMASNLTPQSITAAQMAFAPKQTPQQSQQQAKTKKGTSNLGKSNKEYKTVSQSAEADRGSRE